jgi:uncharacterized damage-inducible protein DinB
MNIQDLIGYNHAFRRLYLESMAKLPWSEVVNPRGVSFDSMRDVFLHLTLVEDRWINYAIIDRFSEWVDLVFDDFQTIDSLKNYARQVEIKTQNYLQKLTTEELNRLIVVPWGEKPCAKLSVEAVLTHMVMEDMVHYGELSALLWQMSGIVR